MTRKLTKGAAACLGGAALTTVLGVVGATPAHAFTNTGSLTASGVTYYVKAHSCNTYWRSCSWDTLTTISRTKSFTHRSDVKSNGFGVSLTISADASATITGNHTTLATATEKGYGRSNSMAGVAKPSIFSVSVAARSRVAVGSVSVNSGWTTW